MERLLTGEKEMILKKSKSNWLRTWLKKDGSLKPLFYEILARFPIALRQYFAGIWDGEIGRASCRERV